MELSLENLGPALLVPKSSRERRVHWFVVCSALTQTPPALETYLSQALQSLPRLQGYLFQLEKDSGWLYLTFSLTRAVSDPRCKLAAFLPNATYYLVSNKELVRRFCCRSMPSLTSTQSWGFSASQLNLYRNKYALLTRTNPTPKEIEVLRLFKKEGLLQKKEALAIKDKLRLRKEIYRLKKFNYFALSEAEKAELKAENIDLEAALAESKRELLAFQEQPHYSSSDNEEEEDARPLLRSFFRHAYLKHPPTPESLGEIEVKNKTPVKRRILINP